MKFNNHHRIKGKTAKGLGGPEAVFKGTQQRDSKSITPLAAIPSPLRFRQLEQGFATVGYRLSPLCETSLYLGNICNGMHDVLSDMNEAARLLKLLGGNHGQV